MTFSLTAGPFQSSGWSTAWASLITAANGLASYVQSVKGYSSPKYEGVQVGRMPSFAVSYNNGSGYISASYIEWVNAMRAELSVPSYTLSDAFYAGRIPFLNQLQELEGVAGFGFSAGTGPSGSTLGIRKTTGFGSPDEYEEYGGILYNYIILPGLTGDHAVRRLLFLLGSNTTYPVIAHARIKARLSLAESYWGWTLYSSVIAPPNDIISTDSGYVVSAIMYVRNNGIVESGLTLQEYFDLAVTGDGLFFAVVGDTEQYSEVVFSWPNTSYTYALGYSIDESVQWNQPPTPGENEYLIGDYIHKAAYLEESNKRLFRINEE